MSVTIRLDDLMSEATRALVAAHVTGMHENTPAGSVHALDIDQLLNGNTQVWSAWIDDDIAGIGALMRRDAESGELKSMRVAERYLGRGVGRAILRHIMEHARSRGLRTLWLETGSTDDFLPARRLYASEGFIECEPFAPYSPDPLSTFMTRAL